MSDLLILIPVEFLFNILVLMLWVRGEWISSLLQIDKYEGRSEGQSFDYNTRILDWTCHRFVAFCDNATPDLELKQSKSIPTSANVQYSLDAVQISVPVLVALG